MVLNRASHYCALLEGRKVYELRRHRLCAPRRVLFVCSKAVRRVLPAMAGMIEGRLTRCRGPYTAAQIIRNRGLLDGVLLKPQEVRAYLPAGSMGFLYEIARVRPSASKWGTWEGNGSNCTGAVPRVFTSGAHGSQERWVDYPAAEPDQPAGERPHQP